MIIDLEDAVPNDQKRQARETVAAWLSGERPVYVRVNGATTAWFRADVEALARPGLAGIILPNAEDPAQIAEVVDGIPQEARVIPLLETAVGIWNAREIATGPRVEHLAFGAIDFQLDTGIDGDNEELLYARSRLVLASRVAGTLAPLDGITVALDDAERLRADVIRAQRLGFGGKLCIHPSQVEEVNRGFTLTEREVAWARRVLEAAEAATGAIRFEGEVIDRPRIERAKRIIGWVTTNES